MAEEKKPLIEFPSRFPIKIMGERHEAFASTILTVVQVHAPGTTEVDVVVRESSGGRYLSLTVTVTATSQEQLDNIYRAVTSHPMAKYVL
jgi:putative lipoic acid-binding regulatory protein